MLRALRQHRRNPQRRRGLTTPLVAAALLVAMLGLALVLDLLWLEAAQLEATTASEAAALAAARQLASDELLRPEPDQALLQQHARNAAAEIAAANRIAGQPVLIDPLTDVACGREAYSEETGTTTFLTTEAAATEVRVTTHRTRFRGNPIALFIGELTRQPHGDVVVTAGAGLNNQIIGVRPFDDIPVPAMPIAIWERDLTGERQDTWESSIEQRRGDDQFAFDEESNQVILGSDGIPELVLRGAPSEGPTTRCNTLLVDVGNNLESDELARQFASGWTRADLEGWGGMLTMTSPDDHPEPATPAIGNAQQPASSTSSDCGLTLPGTPRLTSVDPNLFDTIVGQPRIVLLYSHVTFVQGGTASVCCSRLAAVRVMDVQASSDGCVVTVQPTVLTTRTALAAGSVAGIPSGGAAANPYIYRLQLTH